MAENLIIHVIMGIIKDKLSFWKPRGTCGKTCVISCTKLLNSSLESDEKISFLEILTIGEWIFPVISIVDRRTGSYCKSNRNVKSICFSNEREHLGKNLDGHSWSKVTFRDLSASVKDVLILSRILLVVLGDVICPFFEVAEIVKDSEL